MRFARLQCDSERMPAGLAELAAQELDFLQLDYARPRVVPASEIEHVEFPGWAAGIGQVTKALVKPLFLDAEFHVVTSAGWGDAYGCVERMASVLVDGGCGNLPIAAVRGSNLLPILNMLELEGVKLTNADTGAAWKELRAPILAADLQLGAGPIATALAENARVIVAGCYDDVAPATAFAVQRRQWSWRDYDCLASAAFAARAAQWRHWGVDRIDPTTLPWKPGWIELHDDRRFTLNGTVSGPSAAFALRQWLQQEHSDSLRTADVRLDPAALTCEATGSRQISGTGVNGAASDGAWRLEILYQAGYSAEAMVEFTADADPQVVQYLAEAAKAYLVPEHDDAGLLTVAPLQSATHSGASWLHLAYQSKSRKACQFFADQAVRLVSAHGSLAPLAADAPRVRAHCGVWPVRVPRGAVDIAVETRTAKEWV